MKRSKARKTVQVRDILDHVNRINQVTFENGDADGPAVRRGANAVLERVLFDAGAYRGFRHLDIERGHANQWVTGTYDDTARCYYIDSALQYPHEKGAA